LSKTEKKRNALQWTKIGRRKKREKRLKGRKERGGTNPRESLQKKKTEDALLTPNLSSSAPVKEGIKKRKIQALTQTSSVPGKGQSKRTVRGM